MGGAAGNFFLSAELAPTQKVKGWSKEKDEIKYKEKIPPKTLNYIIYDKFILNFFCNTKNLKLCHLRQIYHKLFL